MNNFKTASSIYFVSWPSFLMKFPTFVHNFRVFGYKNQNGKTFPFSGDKKHWNRSHAEQISNPILFSFYMF
ncbi:hypothetical protein EHR05_14025 [Leptospira licerasiae]|nr:hypothetical protein EHR05_14025 [Leptospira licerasiae]